MKTTINGRAWVFGDNVDTDQIIQGRYLTLLDYGEMAKHAFEIPRPDFAAKVNHGDIIVAGTNFGAGSSREEAPRIIHRLGIGCVVAESFARIFFRNAFNIGLPALKMPGVKEVVADGDIVTVNLADGVLVNNHTKKKAQGERIADFMLPLLDSNGAVALFNERKARSESGDS